MSIVARSKPHNLLGGPIVMFSTGRVKLMMSIVYRTLLFVMVMLVGVVNYSVLASPVTLEFWNNLQEMEMRKLVADYNRAHPNVEVKLSQIPGFCGGTSQKFVVAVVSGAAPDVVIQDSAGIPSAASRGLLARLDQYAERADIDENAFVPFAWERVRYQGSLWALPFSADARAMYINLVVFSNMGVSVSEVQDIESLDLVSDKLSKQNAEGIWEQLGFIPWWGNWGLVGWNWAFGGKLYDYKTDTLTVNHKKMLDALTWQQRVYAEKYSLDSIANLASSYNSFTDNRLGMLAAVCNFSPTLQSQNVDYQIIPVPHPPDGAKTTWCGMWSLSMSPGTRHPEETWDFLKWLAGPEAQSKWATMTREIPTVSQPSEQYLGRVPKQDLIFLDLLQVGHG